VASSNSINRKYQSLFLNSLRRYFDAGKRLVKQNDIIAVSIDIDQSRWLEGVGNDGDHRVDLIDFQFVQIPRLA
jgi:peroxin-6